jgi:Tfp pilus assembly protein PilF
LRACISPAAPCPRRTSPRRRRNRRPRTSAARRSKPSQAPRRRRSRNRSRCRRPRRASRRSQALVQQAQAQLAVKNYAVAAGSIERALRIEPDNPLLWIELAKVRQAEGNYVQAENLARKAVSMSVQAPRTQAQAWQLIAETYRARGKNIEAQDAEAKAKALLRR